MLLKKWLPERISKTENLSIGLTANQTLAEDKISKRIRKKDPGQRIKRQEIEKKGCWTQCQTILVFSSTVG
jgi:hypothetical protein